MFALLTHVPSTYVRLPTYLLGIGVVAITSLQILFPRPPDPPLRHPPRRRERASWICCLASEMSKSSDLGVGGGARRRRHRCRRRCRRRHRLSSSSVVIFIFVCRSSPSSSVFRSNRWRAPFARQAHDSPCICSVKLFITFFTFVNFSAIWSAKAVRGLPLVLPFTSPARAGDEEGE